ncbi:MAG: methyltransferase domain-containing protein [Nitrospiria bacterium]
MTHRKCRFCGTLLRHSFCDLGVAPPSNAFLSEKQCDEAEVYYPLHAKVCESCFLVQLPQYQSPSEIFREYVYFSSYSSTWVCHVKQYAEEAVKRFRLNAASQVIEVASNDGYLLEHFKAKGIPVLGVEPAENVAAAAIKKGIPTRAQFFGVEAARAMLAEGISADLLIGNNVLAHVPDLHDFVAGLKLLLRPGGRITLEFPHLLALIEQSQFDTIYHEHFSYFSLLTAEKLFLRHQLKIFDVESLETHGGSLRVFLCHQADEHEQETEAVARLRQKERAGGLHRIETYAEFSKKAEEARLSFLAFLISHRYDEKKIAAYGAPAKGNTLLNYCGIRPDLLPYTVDRNPCKQGKFLPGSRVPVFHPDKIKETQPDYLVILPWNLKSEIMAQMAFIRKWHGKFVVPIPRVQVLA